MQGTSIQHGAVTLAVKREPLDVDCSTAHVAAIKFEKSQSAKEGDEEDPGREETSFDLKEQDDINYDCPSCELQFTNQTQLTSHVKKVHPGTKPYKCPLCQLSLTTYKEHMNIHTGDKPFKCSNCTEIFENSKSLLKHRQHHEIGMLDSQTVDPEFITIDDCRGNPICSKNVEKLAIRKKQLQIDCSYDCPLCKCQFSSQKKLEVHVKKAHPGAKPYKCQLCNVGLTRMTAYKEHMNMHTSEKPFECAVCHEKFANSKSLYRHREKHEKLAEKKCLQCKEEFSTWDDFKKHTNKCNRENLSLSHAAAKPSDRPFICNVCGLGLSRIGSLNEHMNTHTGETPYACVWCKDRFPNNKTLSRHTLKHDRKNPKCCAKCQKEFDDWNNFKDHIDLAACKMNMNICKVCNDSFTRLLDMETHYRVSHPEEEKLYGCPMRDLGCEKRFCHKHLLFIHSKTHTKKLGGIDCQKCGQKFTDCLQKESHECSPLSSEPKKKTFNCPVCEYNNTDYKSLIEHVKTHAEEPPEPIDPPPSLSMMQELRLVKAEQTDEEDDSAEDFFDSKPTYVAQLSNNIKNNDIKTKLELTDLICDLKRENNTDFDDKLEKTEQSPKKKHKSKKTCNELASERLSNNFVCKECGKQFVSSKNLKAHMNVHAELLQYQCHHCGARLRYHKSLRRHMDLHMGDMNIVCDFSDCTEKFKTKKQLDIHLHQHTDGKRSYTCSLCGKSFSLKKVLIQHYKIHGERSFKCTQCPLAFTTNARLRVHSKVHTDIKLFLCSECGKNFRTKFTLDLHLKRHNNESQYACKYRSKGFVALDGLKVHERTHTGEKPFVCIICNKALSAKRALLAHMRIHTGEKPFACTWPYCTSMFRDKASLSNHYRAHSGL